MNVAIIGCGFIGEKRANFLADCRLVACADAVKDRAVEFARKKPGVEAAAHWQEAVARPDVDIVVVATTHNALAEITAAAIMAGKHVLVE
ncbi:MAG: Gfo/Idh/MocA family oxidoreductase, partial [Deltaproteobacteria bacterium]|nr:Gfo/Idh/MocA family oxidoreductase [Deltaproteobacteria bacterium]